MANPSDRKDPRPTASLQDTEDSFSENTPLLSSQDSGATRYKNISRPSQNTHQFNRSRARQYRLDILDHPGSSRPHSYGHSGTPSSSRSNSEHIMSARDIKDGAFESNKSIEDISESSSSSSTDLGEAHKILQKGGNAFGGSKVTDVYEDEDLAEFYEPCAEYEGRHRFDPKAQWTEKEEKQLVRKVRRINHFWSPLQAATNLYADTKHSWILESALGAA